MKVNNNPNLQQAVQIFPLNKKDKDSFHKLAICDNECHGDEKDRTRDDLIRIASEVKQCCKNRGVNCDKMFNVWMSVVFYLFIQWTSPISYKRVNSWRLGRQGPKRTAQKWSLGLLRCLVESSLWLLPLPFCPIFGC